MAALFFLVYEEIERWGEGGERRGRVRDVTNVQGGGGKYDQDQISIQNLY